MIQIDLRHLETTDVLLSRRGLAEVIDRYCRTDGVHQTPIPGLVFIRHSAPTAAACAVVKSVFATIAQGAKRVALADEVYDYDRGHYLVTSVGLPLLAQVTEASPHKPYLGAGLELNPLKISRLMSKLPPPRPSAGEGSRGVAVSPVTPGIGDAVLRLARLVETPADIPVLAPLFEQELIYLLLTGEQGRRLSEVAVKGSNGHRVSRAIDWVNENFRQTMDIDDLAADVSMSKSSLHHHFKALTSMSPLQYQKALRLQEARRLMLVEQLDAASACHRVGYESPSQFSREYRRMFGAPPLKDIAQMRETA